MKKTEQNSLLEWVNYRMLRGKYFFTKEDIISLNLPVSNQVLLNGIQRLEKKHVIMSPWQNFYVIIPTEYKLKGIVPALFYIDKLMTFLKRDYYISLLTAAEFYGASHQRAMVFQLTVNGLAIRSGIKNGVRVNFTLRKNLPMDFVRKVNSQTGTLNVACPELTALDVVAETKKVGGLGRSAELLIELCESTKWDEGKLPLLSFFSIATVQRLGYLLDFIEEHNQADSLYDLMKKTGKIIRTIPLSTYAKIGNDMVLNNRWKVIENCKFDIDEI